jgi:hypothetical protein
LRFAYWYDRQIDFFPANCTPPAEYGYGKRWASWAANAGLARDEHEAAAAATRVVE